MARFLLGLVVVVGNSSLFAAAAVAADARAWIYSQLGERRTVRDRRYKLDSSGAFYDLRNDPLERSDLRADTDPAAVAARQSLSRVLAQTPPDAPKPFEGFGGPVARPPGPPKQPTSNQPTPK